MPTSEFEYVAYGVQHCVYSKGNSYDKITIDWSVSEDQFTVAAVHMPNRNHPNWIWYRMNVKMSIVIGGAETILFNTGMQNMTNSTAFSSFASLCDDFANTALPKTFTITSEATPFKLVFGGTTTPVYPYSQGGGYSVQDAAALPQTGGTNLSPIPVELKYRPGAIRLAGRNLSVNRSGGKAQFANNDKILSKSGGKAVSQFDMSTYFDGSTWRRQHKL
jgi:hypothetical protein